LRRSRLSAAFDVAMFPILNPNSLARGGRTNLDEIDLDRRISDPTAIDTRSANGLQLAQLCERK
jgi:hypothetical protein